VITGEFATSRKSAAAQMLVALRFAGVDRRGVHNYLDSRLREIRRVEKRRLPLTLLNSPRTFDIIKCRTLKCAAEWQGQSAIGWAGAWTFRSLLRS